jgi:phospholipid/cholesterol/gamma-HCH transport system permease protein
MRLTEQIDALEALGRSPRDLLIAPRVLACMVALPLLTVFIIFCSMAGGYLAEASGGSMSWSQYQGEYLRPLRLGDILPAILKTVVFGYLIGVAGCYFGMTAQGGTEGVGRAATRAVVVSTFLVLVSNVLLVRAIQIWT